MSSTAHKYSKSAVASIIKRRRKELYFMGSRGHGGRVETLLPPTSEAEVRFTALPQVGKLVVACRWSAVYSTEP